MRRALLLAASALIALQPILTATAADEKRPAKKVVVVEPKIEFHFPGVMADEIVVVNPSVTVVVGEKRIGVGLATTTTSATPTASATPKPKCKTVCDEWKCGPPDVSGGTAVCTCQRSHEEC